MNSSLSLQAIAKRNTVVTSSLNAKEREGESSDWDHRPPDGCNVFGALSAKHFIFIILLICSAENYIADNLET
jgi:hypothetical protein